MGKKVSLKRIANKLSPLRLIFGLAHRVTNGHQPAPERKLGRSPGQDVIHKKGPDDDGTPDPPPPNQARRHDGP
jgi:hypothetical protein